MADILSAEPRGARILCLDDGGIRCMSSLFILHQLMERLKERLGVELAPEPWQHFDLICGTGFGGILALMLGRLRMSILHCQEWFMNFSLSVFEQRQTWMKTWTTPTPEERSRVLEEAIKSLMLDYSNDRLENCHLESAECNKTFVLSMYASNMRVPARLRSYSSRMDSATKDISVWEAAMATTASPGEFTQIKIGPMSVPYVSAGLGFSNPAKEALDEADRIWHVSNIGCMVSIGTGVMPPAHLESYWESMNFLNFLSLENIARVPELLTTFFRAATDCERVHEELLRDARLLNLKYFRFNVDDGLQDVGRNDASKLDKIKSATTIYLGRREVLNSLVFCASQISNDPPDGRRQPDYDLARIENGQSKTPCKHQESSRGVVPPARREQDRSQEPGEWNLSSLFDTKFEDVTLEGSYTSAVADEWFEYLRVRVHAVIQRRPRDDYEKAKVAILDTGIDASHPAFLHHVFNDENCKDWTGSGGPTVDKIGHGTHSAALVLKIAPNASLYIGKVFDSVDGNVRTPTLVAEAIKHATEVWKVNIITMSFGFTRHDDQIRDVIEKAQNKGVIFLAAASNAGAVEGQDAAFPARMIGKVIKISSADGRGAPSKYNPPASTRNDNFSMLGEAVKSAWPKTLHESGEKRCSGTSVATPVAAGIAALLLEFASQSSGPDELYPIKNSEALWTYYGMRAMFDLMSRGTLKDGFNWVSPWALFSNGSRLERTDAIAGQISYLLDRL